MPLAGSCGLVRNTDEDHSRRPSVFQLRMVPPWPTAEIPPESEEIGIRMMSPTEDAELVLDAMAYVEEINRELTAENTAPPPGVEGRVVRAIIADPALAQYVRDWATRNRVLEASIDPPERPPIDDTYRRVRNLLIAAEGGEVKPR